MERFPCLLSTHLLNAYCVLGRPASFPCPTHLPTLFIFRKRGFGGAFLKHLHLTGSSTKSRHPQLAVPCLPSKALPRQASPFIN